MRTHGGAAAALDVRSVVRSEAEEAEAQLVELLSRGLDFKAAAEEAATSGEDASMADRVQALAGALAEKLDGASDAEVGYTL